MQIEEFCVWLAGVVNLDAVPAPCDRLVEDLILDRFELLNLATALDQFVRPVARIGPNVYVNLASVRELYLYYLGILSCPIGEDL